MAQNQPRERDAFEHRSAHAVLGLAVLASALVGCGSRTGLLELDGGPSAPCTEPPWLLVQYIDWVGDRPIADVYAMRPDGSELRRVALPDAQVYYPTVSADGRLIAYVISGEAPDSSTLVVYDTRSRTTDRVPFATGISYPTFSPDTTLISFANGLDLHVARADGTGDLTLINGPYDIGCCSWGYGHPVFADDTTILWTTAGMSGAIQTDGTGMTTLLRSDFRALPFPNPTLSPDRTQLAALLSCADTFTTELRIYELASLPVDCTAGRIVAEGLLSYANITHSPNPSWGPTDVIAFTQATDVFVVDAAGGTPRNVTWPLTASSGAAGNPVWAPGCTRLP